MWGHNDCHSTGTGQDQHVDSVGYTLTLPCPYIPWHTRPCRGKISRRDAIRALGVCGSDLGRTFLTSGLDLLIQFLQVLYTLSTQICLNERERGEEGGGEMEAEGKGERTRRKNC